MPRISAPYPWPCTPVSGNSRRSWGALSRWPCSVPLPDRSGTGPRKDDRGCRLSSRRSPYSRSHLVWLPACNNPMLVHSTTALEAQNTYYYEVRRCRVWGIGYIIIICNNMRWDPEVWGIYEILKVKYRPLSHHQFPSNTRV